jgi:hypothetical protein
MKFAKYLAESQISEWKAMYIDYKKLKKVLKQLRDWKGEDEVSEHRADAVELMVHQEHAQSSTCLALLNSLVCRSDSKGDTNNSENIELEDQQMASAQEHSCSNPADLIQVIQLEQENPLLEEHKVAIRSYSQLDDPNSSKAKSYFENISGRVIDPQQSNRQLLGGFHDINISDIVPNSLQKYEVEVDFLKMLYSEVEKVFTFVVMTEEKLRKQVTLTIHALDNIVRKSSLNLIPLVFRKSKKETRRICMELHLSLRMVKNFLSINIVALSKILKKHDKLSDWKEASKDFFRYEHFFLNSKGLDENLRILEKSFADYENALLGKNYAFSVDTLRNNQKNKLSHSITCGSGTLCGTFLGILISFFFFIYLIDASGLVSFWDRFIIDGPPFGRHVRFDFTSTIPLFRVCFVLSLALVFWGIDLWIFDKLKINAKFITNSDTRTFLRSNQVMLVGLFAFLISFVSFILYLSTLSLEDEIYILKPYVFAILPLCVFLAFMIWPLKSLYSETRKYFWGIFFGVIIAPFKSVRFEHFFLADQLVSMPTLIPDILYCLVYFFSGSFKNGANSEITFLTSMPFILNYFMLTILPPWFRFAQCIRRYWESGSRYPHLLNAGKYFSSMLAICIGCLYRIYYNTSLVYWWFAQQFFATLYGYYWDLAMDWNLVTFTRGRKWWIVKVHLSHRMTPLYAFLSALNLLLRMLFVVNFTLFTNVGLYSSSFRRELSVSLFSLLELYRRFQWNILRLENEHLNNCGEFRTIVDIPEDLDLNDK